MMIIKILKESRGIMAICLFFFIIGTLPGFLFFEETKNEIAPTLENIAKLVEGKTRFQTALNIFYNNLKVSLILLVSGTFIIVPFFILFTNGFLVGFVLKLLFERDKDIIFFIKGVILHSGFELSAIFISAALGIRIGTSYFTRDNEKRVKKVSERIREAATVYILIVIPLLLIAAFIETFVSAELIL